MAHVRRYSRLARWFHAAVYLTVLSLLITGWWFLVDGYETQLTGQDLTIHEATGILLTLITVLFIVVRVRAVRAFLRESTEYRTGEWRWLTAWPRAVFSGRFRHHDGRYDPGQRLANIVILSTLAALVVSGFGVLFASGGIADASMVIHRWATFLVTPVLLGHMIVASGVLPGYRGVWRSMHLGGRLPEPVARRLWPGWLEQARGEREEPAPTPATRTRDPA